VNQASARGDDPKPAAPDPSASPKDAASIILFDDDAGRLRILMGQRQTGQAFMPDVYVFPGGRVDDADTQIVVSEADGLDPGETRKLLSHTQGHPSTIRAQALAIAGIRETFEEAGVILGRAAQATELARCGLPEGGPWASFIQHGVLPHLRPLTFLARAITPPGRTRRYDTRFFCLHRRQAMGETGLVDGELSNLDWYDLDRITALNTAPITRIIISEFLDRYATGPMRPSPTSVPFYHQTDGTFRRDLIAPENC